MTEAAWCKAALQDSALLLRGLLSESVIPSILSSINRNVK